MSAQHRDWPTTLSALELLPPPTPRRAALVPLDRRRRAAAAFPVVVFVAAAVFVCHVLSLCQALSPLTTSRQRQRRYLRSLSNRRNRAVLVPSSFYFFSTTARVGPHRSAAATALRAAKKKGGSSRSSSSNKSKTSSSSSSSAAGIRGFGSGPSSSGANNPSATGSASGLRIDRSSRAIRFYEYLERNGAGGSNLRRTALAMTALDGMRGVVATRDVAKGEDLLSIPYEIAVNLGRQGDDPTIPAWRFLQDYGAVMATDSSSPPPLSSGSDRKAYYEMLPALGSSPDYLTSTDFFSPEALRELQSPLIVEETLKRRERVRRHWDSMAATAGEQPEGAAAAAAAMRDSPQGGDFTFLQLQWAVWLVTSRVLTVQGSSPSEQFRLLIPYLDMCNHDRCSPHVLTGRAAPGGKLRVVAGRNVRAGEFVDICYGGGVTGNDRFVQDYGFLDSSPDAYRIVARQLTGRARVPADGASGGRFLSEVDCDRSLEALRATTLKQDEAELRLYSDSASNSSSAARLDVRTAIQYRIGVKKALAEFR